MECKSIDPKFDEVCKNPINNRFCQFCLGTSGLPREKEEFFLGQAIKKPGVLSKVVGLATSIKDFAFDGFKTCSDEEYRERLSCCEKCEFYTNSKCSLCGCYTAVKSKMEISNCPHPLGDKWAEAKKSRLSLEVIQ